MQFDIEKMAAMDRYELLLGTVVPRPVALVTTISATGAINAAPYSLFNVMGHDPAVAVISVLAHPDRRLKDTADNILATKQFVLNLVSERLAEAMNITCIDAPPGTNELELAKLQTSPSIKVKPPRVTESPVSYECRFLTSLSLSPNQAIIVGQIVHAYVDDQYVRDAAHGVVDTPRLNLFGAMHGARWYAKLSDRFAMDRPTWAEWVGHGEAG
ncbi:MAG TPA: flavin reductase family protein [Xanthobacteraceae bacterium]|jgi:flavin reductase (DIM6/NTAB) family NADH-FMN oxidoreductase RutF